MNRSPLASIVINNYNYGRFLVDAIESALAQTYDTLEVIVVDDGSTDDSRDVIESFAGRVTPVLKSNGGQASAFNAGFAASRGDIVFMLDADDWLAPDCVGTVLPLFAGDAAVVKAHWPLAEVNASGHATGRQVPAGELPCGDLRELVLREGPTTHANPPCSGNAWARRFLERVLPMPEQDYRIGADAYLLELAPLFGPLRRVSEPLGFYRVHGGNNYAAGGFDERQRFGLALYDRVCRDLGHTCVKLGYASDPEVFAGKSCFHRIARALEEIDAAVPRAASLILVDQDEWGTDDVVGGRRRFPFPEFDLSYAGLPVDDCAAVEELERVRAFGTDYVVVAWPAFWWLDHYAGLRQHLAQNATLASESDVALIYKLAERDGIGRAMEACP